MEHNRSNWMVPIVPDSWIFILSFFSMFIFVVGLLDFHTGKFPDALVLSGLFILVGLPFHHFFGFLFSYLLV